MRRSALRLPHPLRILRSADPLKEKELVEAWGYPPAAAARAGLCLGQTCLPPVSTPRDMEAALSSIRRDSATR